MTEKKQGSENLRDALNKLKDLNLDELSEEELQEVAGGAEECSNWCCSDDRTVSPSA